MIEGDRTHTVVTRLEGDVSLHELASLLGADNEENLQAVKAMLHEADTYKKANAKKQN